MQTTQKLRALRVAALISAVALFDFRAAHAEVPVDDLLAGVAEVVKDRAKKAAARAIKRNIVDNLCKEKPIAFTVNNAALTIGGDDACFKDRTNKACDADDVFVASCRLLRHDAMALSDPYFLRTLGGDTVEFVFRVAASRFDVKEYSEHGLDKLAETTFDLATAILEDKPVGPAVASALDEVASVVGKDFPKVTLQALRPKGLELYKAVRKYLIDGCTAGDEVCKSLTGAKEGWDIDLGTTNDQSSCASWKAKSKARNDSFESLFGAKPPGQVTYAEFREETPCGGSLTTAQKAECTRGRLTYNLLDHASKVICSEYLGPSEARVALRQLTYVYAQMSLYEGYLSADSTSKTALDAYATDIRALPLKGVPAEELANTIRLVAVLIRSSGSDRAELEKWLDLLRKDFESLVGQLDSTDLDKAYMAFLRGSALAPDKACLAGTCNTAVNNVREAVKNLLVTPYLYVPGSKDFKLFRQRIRGMATLISTLRAVKTGADLREVVKATADLLELIGSEEAAGELETLVEARFTASASLLTGIPSAKTLEMVEGNQKSTGQAAKSVALALGELSFVIDFIGERDWVGLAIHASHVLDEAVDDKQLKPLRRSFKFMRVLMGMYQADTKDEAKEIFAAALDDEASREERYDRGSVDIAALVGAGAGAHILDPADSTDLHGLGGLYAPFGLQLTYKCVGVMLYPIDLGAYLVASSEEPTWTEAVRGGAVFEIRPWQYTPLDFFVGVDYRPQFEDDDQDQLRVLGGVALELPLFGLN